MPLKAFTRTILVINPLHGTPIEYQFWKEFGAYSARQGWRLITINIISVPTPPMKGVLSLDMASSPVKNAAIMRHLPAKGLELSLPWLSKEDVDLSEEFLVRLKPDQPYNKMMTPGLIRLAHFIDTTVRTLRPAVVLTWNAPPPIVALFRKAGLYYGSYTILVERSPFDSIWVEEKGLFAESQIWQCSREKWSNGSHELYKLGMTICNRLAYNPNSGFRARQRTKWNKKHDLRRPLLFLPMDNVVFTYWGQKNHPQGKIDYPLFDEPHQAIAELARIADYSGWSLVVKSHPSCKEITREKMPEGVEFVDPKVDLSDVIDSADIAIAFNTKVAFSALAMNKPVVTLAPNPIAASGATYHCTEIGKLHDVIKEALNKTDFEQKIHLFRNFCGFLASEVFYGASTSDKLHLRGPEDLVDNLVAKSGPIVPDSEDKTYRILRNIAMLARGDRAASYDYSADEPDTKALSGDSKQSVRIEPIYPPGWTKEPSPKDRVKLYFKKLWWKPINYLMKNYPTMGTIGRFGKWGLTTLKKTFFGIGGIALLVIIGLYVAGALIEPLRWYLVGIASGLLLLGGGLLALYYAKLWLNRFTRNQWSQVSDIRRQVSDIRKQVSDVRKQVSNINKQVSGLKKDISASKNTLAKMNVGNFPLFQRFNRRLINEDLKRFAVEWVPKLGVSLDSRALAYIAHRICLAEDTCVGRLSGNIETMLLRVLVARSVMEPNLEVLEIGTLFGVGVAMIHENCLGLFSSMHFTVIDPFVGHIGRHDKTPLDVLTKAPATRETFIHNMQRMNIPESDYTIIEHLSTEDEAIEQASKKRYNVLIIDADHSYFGVTHDFYNYRHLVKRGGYIIFDDYGNPNWPELTDFVDKEVAKMPDLEFVGTDVYSAVFRVIAPTIR